MGLFCVFLTCIIGAVSVKPPVDLQFVLGGLITWESNTRSSLAFWTEMRAAATGVLLKRNSELRIVLSGGYNVGIQYWANGTVMPNSNFSFSGKT